MQTVDIEETRIGVNAILVTQDGKVILQQRDNNPNIVNPGLISMFGGTIKKSEDHIEALKRELHEELELTIKVDTVKKLNTYFKTKELDRIDWEVNVFIIHDINPNQLHLHEGKGIIIDTPENLVKYEKLTRITKLALEDYTKLETK